MLRAVLPAQADPVATGRRSLKTAASANPGRPFCSFIGLGSRRECVMGIPAATRRASGPLRVILAREAVTPTTAGLRSAAEAPLQRRNWRRVPLPDSRAAAKSSPYSITSSARASQRGWYLQPKRHSCPKVYRRFIPGRRLHRKVGRISAVQRRAGCGRHRMRAADTDARCLCCRP